MEQKVRSMLSLEVHKTGVCVEFEVLRDHIFDTNVQSSTCCAQTLEMLLSSVPGVNT